MVTDQTWDFLRLIFVFYTQTKNYILFLFEAAFDLFQVWFDAFIDRDRNVFMTGASAILWAIWKTRRWALRCA